MFFIISFFPSRIFLSHSYFFPLPLFFLSGMYIDIEIISFIISAVYLYGLRGIRTDSYRDLLLTFISVNRTNILKQIIFWNNNFNDKYIYDNNLFHILLHVLINYINDEL